MSFTTKAPFDNNLFVEIRKRMGLEQLNMINDMIYLAAMGNQAAETVKTDVGSDDDNGIQELKEVLNDHVDGSDDNVSYINRGCMLVEATACPPQIVNQTDIGLLNVSHEKCEEIIDKLFTR